jgi:predicted SprT family Zn-dependent metalloprotease
MDEHSYTSNGVPVITGDASGTQGAAHHKGDMLIWEYPQELCAPVQSSNYRELDTVVRPLEAWGSKFAGGRVLARSDNSTAVAVVNRRGTTSSNLQALGHELVAVCKRHDIDLAAIHIPGVQNGLADRGSRFKRVLDHVDWMLSKRAFQHVVDEVRERRWGCRNASLTRCTGCKDKLIRERALHTELSNTEYNLRIVCVSC